MNHEIKDAVLLFNFSMMTPIRALTLVGLAAGTFFGAVPESQALVIRDDFNTYTQGSKPFGTELTIPYVEPTLTPPPVWTTIIGGGSALRSVSILDATPYERTGQVIAFNTAQETGTAYAYTNVALPAGRIWSQSFDFYVDSFTPTDTGSFMLSAAYSWDFPNNIANRLYGVSVRQTTTGSLEAIMEVATTGVGAGVETRVLSSLTAGKWYTLTINADNDTQRISFSLDDGQNAIHSESWYYRVNTHKVDRWTIGQMHSNGSGLLLMDDFELQTVPEPATALLLLPAIALWVGCARRKKG